MGCHSMSDMQVAYDNRHPSNYPSKPSNERLYETFMNSLSLVKWRNEFAFAKYFNDWVNDSHYKTTVQNLLLKLISIFKFYA